MSGKEILEERIEKIERRLNDLELEESLRGLGEKIEALETWKKMSGQLENRIKYT